MKEKMKEFLFANWSLPEKILLLIDVLLAGVLLGWLTSPFKSGRRWFCNNSFGGRHYTAPEEELFEEDWDE